MITNEITTSIIITATGPIKNKFVGGDLSGAICRGRFVGVNLGVQDVQDAFRLKSVNLNA